MGCKDFSNRGKWSKISSHRAKQKRHQLHFLTVIKYSMAVADVAFTVLAMPVVGVAVPFSTVLQGCVVLTVLATPGVRVVAPTASAKPRVKLLQLYILCMHRG